MGIQLLDACIAGLALWLVRCFVFRRGAILPPGPPGWPVIGNIFDIPRHAPYKTFASMSKIYGPVMSLKAMGKQYVILNTLEAANDLMEKRGAIASNRPHFTMGMDLVGWGNVAALLQYGDRCRKYRSFFHRQIGTKSNLEAFYPAEETESKRFVRNMLKSPQDLDMHTHRTAGIMLDISYGYSVERDDDPLMEMSNKAIRNFCMIATPGRFLVDEFPILRYLPEWFPGCGFHKLAKQWRKMLTEAVHAPHAFVLEHMAKGDAAPSFTSRLLQEGVTPEEEDLLKWAAFSMYLGGYDTTPTVLSAFFIAMTMFPGVFKKAQAEVDAVIGHDRLPTVQDRDSLPYVNALCTELHRWHVLAPIVIHVTTEDIFYGGYFIPKGTHLLANTWSILSNPETYPDPEIFDPERFLGEHKQPDPREAAFGFGRRACPGIHLAGLSIFMCVAMTLATLDISRPVENGVERVPKYEADEGILRHVKPFEFRISARSKKVEDLLDN